MADSPRRALVCFDLGGVLVRIRRTWQEAARAASAAARLPERPLGLSEFPLFDPFQMGAIGTREYLDDLGGFIGLSPDVALEVHNAILESAYPDTLGLVRDLHGADVATGCLSNTNLPHWEIMAGSGSYPAIEELQHKLVSHELKLLKPDPAFFRLFELETETSTEKIVFFDDHQVNVDAARRHGWTSFYIDHEGDPAAQMREKLAELELLPR